jgi:hypothetical protein
LKVKSQNNINLYAGQFPAVCCVVRNRHYLLNTPLLAARLFIETRGPDIHLNGMFIIKGSRQMDD